MSAHSPCDGDVVPLWVKADHPGGLVGIDFPGGATWSNSVIADGQFHSYFTTIGGQPGAVIRVWLYAPASAGTITVDDVVVKQSPPYN